MRKKILIIRKDNVVFTELVDDEESDLFESAEGSLNSFKEDQKLFELNNSRLSNEEKLELPFKNVYSLKKNLKSRLISDRTNSQSKSCSASNKIIKSPINRKTNLSSKNSLSTNCLAENKKSREIYLNFLKNDYKILEQLLDELESLKEQRSKIGKLNYSSNQVKILKRKLVHFIYRQKQNQLTKLPSQKLFSNNEECLKFMKFVLEQDLEFKIDQNLELNSDLNCFLKLNLINELTLSKIFKNLNIELFSRERVEKYIELFRLKLEPQLLIKLINLQKKFQALDTSMKLTLSKYNSLLQNYFELYDQKEMLRLRFTINQFLLIDKFKYEVKQLHTNNLSLKNKINIIERNLKGF